MRKETREKVVNVGLGAKRRKKEEEEEEQGGKETKDKGRRNIKWLR